MQEESNQNSEILLARALAAESKLNLIYSSKLWKLSSKIRMLFPKFFHISKFERKLHVISDLNKKVLVEISPEIKIAQSGHFSAQKGFVIIAHWSEENIFDDAFNFLIDSFSNLNFNLIIASANPNIEVESLATNSKNEIAIITKPNVGYDFGSWLAAINTFPHVLDSSELILLNDSCIGPFGGMTETINKCRSSSFDVTALTDSSRLGYHLQSYFLHFKRPAIESESLINFLSELPVLANKSELVLRYEIGLTSFLQSNGLLCGALFPWNTFSLPWINPSLGNAKKLIEMGSPFIKKEFLKKASNLDVVGIEAKLQALSPESQAQFKNLRNFI